MKNLKSLTNEELALVFLSIAEHMAFELESSYHIRSYREAARIIKKYPLSIFDLVQQKKTLKGIKIGAVLSEKLIEIIQNNGVPLFISLREPPLYKPNYKQVKNRRQIRFDFLMPYVEMILNKLKKLDDVKQIEVAGSYRRKQETIDKIEIILCATKSKKVFDYFLTLPGIHSYSVFNKTQLTVNLKIGIPLTIYNLDEKFFGTKLLELTGSEDHYKKLNVNILTARDEKSVYHQLGMEYIPPELRENRGEIEAATIHRLPKLITLNQIKGDLHSHTFSSDGTASLEDMVNAAMKKGYEYLAITDHTKSLKITRGMDEKSLRKQMEKIDELNSNLKNFQILKSGEVDILQGGVLDLPNSILKELDFVICSVHSRFKLSAVEHTDRIIRAMDNPYFNILGHPTGRLINDRAENEINIEKILKTAKEKNCILELNSQPMRLDIKDIYCMMAKDLNVKIAISSDAHSIQELDYISFGINQARRGWLEADDVINTLSLINLKKIFKR